MKQFTMKEIKLLKKNPYTKSVTENYIRFTIEFKEKFYEMRKKGMLPRTIVKELGYDINILGEARINGISQHIKEQARSADGLRENRVYNFSDKNNNTPSKVLLHLESEVAYLKEELEYIKKIIQIDRGKKSWIHLRNLN